MLALCTTRDSRIYYDFILSICLEFKFTASSYDNSAPKLFSLIFILFCLLDFECQLLMFPELLSCSAKAFGVARFWDILMTSGMILMALVGTFLLNVEETLSNFRLYFFDLEM